MQAEVMLFSFFVISFTTIVCTIFIRVRALSNFLILKPNIITPSQNIDFFLIINFM